MTIFYRTQMYYFNQRTYFYPKVLLMVPSDPASIEEDTSKIEDFQKRRDMRFDMLVSSHAAVIVYGYLYTATMRPRTHYEVTIKLLLKDQT